MQLSSTIELNSNTHIPRLGLGVYQSPPGPMTERAVVRALELGYRHIDTAAAYQNEASVAGAIAASGIPRDEIFVTSKLWNSDQGMSRAAAALERSLENLGGRIDLFLLHWPVPKLRLSSWRVLEAQLSDRCRAIGVSNFLVPHLTELLEATDVVPAVNQIELHPYNYRSRIDTIELCRAHGIAIEAYSPLTRGERLDEPRLVEIAERNQRTPAQILIRWSLQHDFIVIPKSTNPGRIEENGSVFDFELNAADMEILDGLDEGLATCWDPSNAP